MYTIDWARHRNAHLCKDIRELDMEAMLNMFGSKLIHWHFTWDCKPNSMAGNDVYGKEAVAAGLPPDKQRIVDIAKTCAWATKQQLKKLWTALPHLTFSFEHPAGRVHLQEWLSNWPQENWHCTPCNPCDHIKQLSKRARARHAERLEYSSATASAEYETEFCEALGKAILQHHGVRIWTESEIKRAERASKRRKRHPEAPETAT